MTVGRGRGFGGRRAAGGIALRALAARARVTGVAGGRNGVGDRRRAGGTGVAGVAARRLHGRRPAVTRAGLRRLVDLGVATGTAVGRGGADGVATADMSDAEPA